MLVALEQSMGAPGGGEAGASSQRKWQPCMQGHIHKKQSGPDQEQEQDYDVGKPLKFSRHVPCRPPMTHNPDRLTTCSQHSARAAQGMANTHVRLLPVLHSP